jgi:biotin/methionine sulfoxide reductase
MAITHDQLPDGWYGTTSHWGAFSVRVEEGRVVSVNPHPDDADPSILLGNIVDSAHHRSRIGRPAIRRGWLAEGPGPTPTRGREPFVEVAWDDALDLVAAELDRVRRLHGNKAIFGGSYGWSSAGRFHHAQSQIHRFLNSIGGYTSSVGNYSHGASMALLPHVVGDAEAVIRKGSSWLSIVEHTELLVAFGGIARKNVSVAPGGLTTHTSRLHFADALRRGMEVVSISPLCDNQPSEGRTTWYPIIPATDTALALGLSHTLVVDNLVNADFVQRYCVGYPEFEAYLRGEHDGVAKDATWAARICGIDADRIRQLAHKMVSRRTFITLSWSLQRAEYGEQPVWACIALAAMLGQIGLPGGGFGHGYGSIGDVGHIAPVVSRPTLAQGSNPVSAFIPVARIADLLLRPGEEFDYNGRKYIYPDIRLVYWAGGNPFHHHQDLNRLRKAIARPDTVVVQEPYWTATARHADVVLPATIALERDDIASGRGDTHVIAMHRALAPYGEAHDDYEIFAELAGRLGVRVEFTEGKTSIQWLKYMYQQWRTQLDEYSVLTPDFAQFWRVGGFRIPLPAYQKTMFAEFRADPDAHALDTPSGRIEIFSSTIANFGYDDCPGHPTWLEPHEWLGSELTARYPLHLVADQPATRLHSQLDMGAISLDNKVNGHEPIRLNPTDAAARGIGDGDIVRVFNDRGSCLAGARISNTLRQRVVQLSTGAWYDPVDNPETGPLCRHGNPNVLTADRGTSRLAQASTGQHCLVEVERYMGDPPEVRAFEPPDFVTSPSVP